MSKPIAFTVQLYDIRTKRDGGGRVSFDFGADALEAIMALQKMNAEGDTNFVLAVIAHQADGHQQSADDGEQVDPITGEVILD